MGLSVKKDEFETTDGLCTELNGYLGEIRIDRKDDVFKYWLGLKSTHPELFQLAVKYLSILATSVPSERLFSKAGLTKTHSRNRLTGEN